MYVFIFLCSVLARHTIFLHVRTTRSQSFVLYRLMDQPSNKVWCLANKYPCILHDSLLLECQQEKHLPMFLIFNIILDFFSPLQKSSQEPHEFSSLCEVISKLVAPVPLPWMKIPDTGCDEPTLSQKEEDEGEAEELAYKPLAIKKLKIQHGKKKKNKQK